MATNPIFPYNQSAFGGTEYMGREFHARILPHVPKLKNYLSLIIPGTTPYIEELLTWPQEMIIWVHNELDQFDPDKSKVLKDPRFISRVKYFIALSESHKQDLMRSAPIKEEQIYIIRNAMEPRAYNKEKFNNLDPIRIINTSNPERSLEVILQSMRYIKEDFRFEIYNKFNPDLQLGFKADPRLVFFGQTPKATVMEALERSHIHAYPSIYSETSCISLMEAMSAGTLSVYSDFGALPETGNGHGIMYESPTNIYKHPKLFAEKLSEGIELIRSGAFDPTEQIEYVNDYFSWEAVKQEWIKFHELL